MRPSFQKHVLAGEQTFILWVRSAPEFPLHLHYHEEYELTCIRRGYGTRIMGEQIVPYAPGDLVLVGPNLPHTWGSAPGPAQAPAEPDAHEAVVLQFNRHLLGAAWTSQPEWKPLLALLERARAGVQFGGAAGRTLGARLEGLLALRGAQRHLGVLGLLVALAQAPGAMLLNPAHAAPAAEADEHALLEKIYNYLHAHCTEPLRLEAVARRFHMSPSTLNRFLKRSTLKTLVEIIGELRISHACGRLAHGGESITEICYASGFNDLPYFYRCFRASKGMTPRAYRAQYAASLPEAQPPLASRARRGHDAELNI